MHKPLKKELIIVCGSICSGKNTIVKRNFPDAEHIVVSDIVRILKMSTNRKDLANSADLDTEISNLISQRIMGCGDDQIVIDGIRQLSIFREITEHHNVMFDIQVVWVSACDRVRKERFESRGAEKDTFMTFEECEELDNQLGLAELKAEIFLNIDRKCVFVYKNN